MADETMNNNNTYADREYAVSRNFSNLIGNVDVANLSDEHHQQISQSISDIAKCTKDRFLAELVAAQISKSVAADAAQETLFAWKKPRYFADIATRAAVTFIMVASGLYVHSRVRGVKTPTKTPNPFAGDGFKASPRPAALKARPDMQSMVH